MSARLLPSVLPIAGARASSGIAAPSSPGLEQTFVDLLRAVVREEVKPLLAELEALRAATSLDRMLPVPEAARHLGVSERTLRRRIRDGSIQVTRIGRAVRVDLGALRSLTPDDVEHRARALSDPHATIHL